MADVESVYHLYVIRLKNNETRNSLQAYLKEQGVATGVHYPIALPYLKAYAYLGYRDTNFPEALTASQEILSLPMFPELTEEAVTYITQHIADFFA